MIHKIESTIGQAPRRLLIAAAVSFLIADLLIMYLTHVLLPPLPVYIELLLNASVLTALGFFILYFFLFRPMIVHINERKHAEETIKKSEERFSKIFCSSPAPISLTSLHDGRFIDMNDSFLRFTGYSREELLGHADLDIGLWFNRDDRNRLMEMINKQGTVSDFEISYNNKHGEIRRAMGTFEHITINGEACLIGLFDDITERKRAEEDIRSLKQRIEFILGATRAGLDIVDSAFNIRYIDPERRKLYGLPDGKKCYEYFMGRDEVCPGCGAVKALETKTTVVKETVLVKEGNRPVQVTSIPFTGLNGERLAAQVYVDIAERKKMEEEHLKFAELESIGVLAGGIAHDFNNILPAIIGSVGFAKLCISKEDDIYEALTIAEQAAMRAKDLTHRMLTFSKGGEPIKKIVSISRLLRNSASFVLSGSSFRCAFALKDDLSPVEVDEGQIARVFNNLLLNAIQAMPEGGTVDIAAENITADANDIPPLIKGKYVKVSISDRGCGIPEENIKKIFDPYFTTREKGSGLGLAIAYSIIEKHRGHIKVESESGKGSTVTVYLPACESPLPIEKKEFEYFPAGKKGRILIMDDEEILRNFVGRMLKKAGYEVSFASDGEEAVELYKQAEKSGEAFDVVIMDLTIPEGAGGKETIQRLLEIYPDSKAIVSSGYSDDPIMLNYKDYGFKAVVEKPYSITELTKIIEDVIAVNHNKPDKCI